MDPLVVTRALVVPADFLSVSYTRDLGAEATAEAARNTPTTVELRFAVGRFPGLSEAVRQRLLAKGGEGRGARAIVRVVCGEHHTRRKNLLSARQELIERIRAALRGDGAPVEAPPPPRKRAGAGLNKTRKPRADRHS